MGVRRSATHDTLTKRRRQNSTQSSNFNSKSRLRTNNKTVHNQENNRLSHHIHIQYHSTRIQRLKAGGIVSGQQLCDIHRRIRSLLLRQHIWESHLRYKTHASHCTSQECRQDAETEIRNKNSYYHTTDLRLRTVRWWEGMTKIAKTSSISSVSWATNA